MKFEAIFKLEIEANSIEEATEMLGDAMDNALRGGYIPDVQNITPQAPRPDGKKWFTVEHGIDVLMPVDATKGDCRVEATMNYAVSDWSGAEVRELTAEEAKYKEEV